MSRNEYINSVRNLPSANKQRPITKTRLQNKNQEETYNNKRLTHISRNTCACCLSIVFPMLLGYLITIGSVWKVSRRRLPSFRIEATPLANVARNLANLRPKVHPAHLCDRFHDRPNLVELVSGPSIWLIRVIWHGRSRNLCERKNGARC